MKDEIDGCDVMSTLEDRCGYYLASRAWRDCKKECHENGSNAERFRNLGCYECDGEDVKCLSYFNPLESYQRGLFLGNKLPLVGE